MNIIGFHLGHDGSAAIVKHGRLVASLASERLSKQRKSHGITPELIDYVMSVAEMHLSDIDAIALSDYHPLYTHGSIQVLDKKTGIPMVMNTSLNPQGYPILETPQDARIFFESHDVDMLVINGEITEK